MFTISIEASRCKGCQLCLHFCNFQVLKLSLEPNASGYYPVQADRQEACTGCRACVLMCPDCVLSVTKEVNYE